MHDFSRRDLSRLAGIGLGASLLGGASLASAAKRASTKTGLALDHIVWAVPDLDAAVRQITDLTGIEPVSGGKAPGREQPHNALLSFGGGSYFEIFSPARAGGGGRWGDAIGDGKPRIVSYALRATDRFEKLRAAITVHGHSFTGPRAMGRVRPDGGAVNWELLNVAGTPFDDALPFFIDWLGSKPHPSESSPKGATIASFVVAHPQADQLAEVFRGLGIDTPVVRAARHAIHLQLNTPAGKVWLT